MATHLSILAWKVTWAEEPCGAQSMGSQRVPQDWATKARKQFVFIDSSFCCLLSLCESVTYWRRQWHPTPVLLPGKSHGRRSLEGCSPWSRGGSDITEWLPFHFSLSCLGKRNGNLLQCSCLENPRDGGAWWAAIYGVTQSWTLLMRLSSSSSNLFEDRNLTF